METEREVRIRRGSRWLCVALVLVCSAPAITGVVDVTIVSKYQFFDESADSWLYCYYTDSLLNQKGYLFGVEVDTGEGTRFTRWRGTSSVTGGKSTRFLAGAGDSRVGAFSCQVRDGSQAEKAITFKMKSEADVWPVTFTVTANTGDPVTLQMVQKSNRTGTLVWRKDGLDGTVLTGQNGLSLTIPSVQSSDEGIYECYYQGDTDRKQGIMRLIVRGCAENKWGPLSCTGDCPVCYNGGVCDDNTGECVCPPGFYGQNCEMACANNKIGTSCTGECEGGDCTGQLLCVMDPYGCSCAPGLMGIECNTECPHGMYGAGCTQTCHCANGPAACDKKTGACTGGCLYFWSGDSCQIRTGCPAGYSYLAHTRMCYRAYDRDNTYDEALAICQADGGTLAMPRDNTTNNFLVELKNTANDNIWFFFGLDRRDGLWEYVDGGELNYTDWGDGEPSNSGGIEECAQYFAPTYRLPHLRNKWNDGNCLSTRGFICEAGVCCDSPKFMNGRITATDGYCQGDTIQFSCNPGYELVGNSSATCREDRSWDREIPTCRRILASPDINIALRKPAFQTSIFANFVAGLAVDGNTNTDFNANSCQHNEEEHNPMWWIDLGNSFMISRVVIFNRHDCSHCVGRLNPFNIHIGDSDQVSTNPQCGSDHQIDITQPSISVSCPGIKGRYVGIRLPGYFRTLTLCEVQVFSATVSYEELFTKEEGRFFDDLPYHIAAYNDIDADECARRCLQGYSSYDGVNPTCLSFNHRPAGSPEGGSARCWLRSSDKDTAASPGSDWDSWPHRNYYQRKYILVPQDCADIFALGLQTSQVYSIGHPQPFQAYCDMDTDGGGWTVIQRRQDGSVPFDRHWAEYEQGFGNPSGEYWLGLETIHSLTTKNQSELYVYLEDWEMNSRFARYSTFSVGDAGSKYTATIDGYSGDATDSLDPSTTRHSINNRQFTTTDQDNDPSSNNCASLFGQGGWWYTASCGWALLNGQYLTGCSVPSPGTCSTADGIVWNSWRGYRYSLKTTVMMIRPADFPATSPLRPCQNGGTLTSGPDNSGLYMCACQSGWNDVFCDQAMSCPELSFPNNGSRTEGRIYGDKVTFSCNEGYELIGSVNRTCQANQSWSGVQPNCSRTPCPQLKPVQHGSISDGGYYGDVVTYQCDPGYEISGDEERTCQANQTWSGTHPTCSRKSCSVLPVPNNGNMTGGHLYGDKVTFTCNDGYKLIGSVNRTCQANQSWSGVQPNCSRTPCPKLTPVQHGSISGGSYYGDVVTYHCDPGYEISGDVERTCQANQTWSGTHPTCSRKACSILINPNNGNRTEGHLYGDKVTFTCNDGYELMGSVNRTCQANQTWSGIQPNCSRTSCPQLKPVQHGSISSGGYYGDVVTYHCDPGYEISGDVERTCQANQTWSGRQPTCSRKACSVLPVPNNGNMTEGHLYGDQVTFTCNDGYELMGSVNRTCQANRTWSGIQPNCTRTPCPQLTPVQHGSITSGGYYGDVVTYHCDPGYEISGDEERTCQDNQTWSGTHPTCSLIISADMTLTGEVFTVDLSDKNHPKYKRLARMIEFETSQAFKDVPGFRQATVKNFRPGSVIATVDMKFQNTSLDQGLDEVLGATLQQYISDNGGRLGNLSVSQVEVVLPLTVDHCQPDPCVNGTCRNGADSFTCVCDDNYEGETCQTPIGYCKEEVVETEVGQVSFPRVDGESFSYSAERCNSSSESEKPLASRFCRITAGRFAVWGTPVVLTCDTDLQDLSQIEVNNETALSVTTELQVITIQAEALSSNDVTNISAILKEIVNASATEQIGDSLLTTVDNLINVNVTVLQQSQQETRGPTRVVQALETFADTVELTSETYTAVRPGVALQAADISPEELDQGQGFAFFLSGDDSNSLKEGNIKSFTTEDGADFQQTADISIFIPPNLSGMIQANNTSEIRLSYTVYNSSRLFVQTSQGAVGPSQSEVGTRIIGCRIAGGRVNNLPEPIIITFTPLQDFLPEDVKEVRCVFWDFGAEAGHGAWSTDGCESMGEENGRYKCACNHLTNFAAIFDVFDVGFGKHEKPLEVITIAGCIMSIICLVLTLLSFVLTRNYKRSSRTGHAKNQRLVLINLCVALLAILVIFLAGINRMASPIGCTVVAALLHYFLLAALVWMAVEAVNIYRAVVLVFDHHVTGSFVIKAAAVAWGFPLVAMVPTAGLSSFYQYRMENVCWLAYKPLLYAFLIPAGLILLFNVLVFVIVMCKLVRNDQGQKQLRANKLSDSDHNRITRQIRRAFSIMALFGLTWVFGFFVINDAQAVFAYLFCIFNTLQGLFIFIFHCVMREDIRKWWKKLSCSGHKDQGPIAVNGSSSFSPAAQASPTFELSTLSSGSKPDHDSL